MFKHHDPDNMKYNSMTHWAAQRQYGKEIYTHHRYLYTWKGLINALKKKKTRRAKITRFTFEYVHSLLKMSPLLWTLKSCLIKYSRKKNSWCGVYLTQSNLALNGCCLLLLGFILSFKNQSVCENDIKDLFCQRQLMTGCVSFCHSKTLSSSESWSWAGCRDVNAT